MILLKTDVKNNFDNGLTATNETTMSQNFELQICYRLTK